MQKENEQITLSGAEILEILKDIEILLTSLHKMGSYYAVKYHEGEINKESGAYEKETTRFIDEWQVTHRLARVRTILSEKFDTTLGDDDMDDVERAMEGLKFWRKPGDASNDILG